MRICLRCDDTRFVCEAHPLLPWATSPRGCHCGAAGDPCPICNRDLLETEPPAIDPADIEDAREALIEFEIRRRRKH